MGPNDEPIEEPIDIDVEIVDHDDGATDYGGP
jgi:hypothetical protein